jgi:hypothetical protein
MQGTSIRTGGLGGAHPYLNSESIPSYIGATNPNSSDWVDHVLSFESPDVLKTLENGDPFWVEDYSELPQPAGFPRQPRSLRIR